MSYGIGTDGLCSFQCSRCGTNYRDTHAGGPSIGGHTKEACHAELRRMIEARRGKMATIAGVD